jgi:hypothetical protein
VKAEHLPEPELEFGGGGRHVDIKSGLVQYGPLDQGAPTAPRDIKVGIVGPPDAVEGLARWLGTCRTEIGAKDSRLTDLFVPFPGCSAVFGVDLALDSTFRAIVQARRIDQVVAQSAQADAVERSVNLFVEEAAYLVENVKPDVLVCVPPANLLEALEQYDPPQRPREEAQEEEDEQPPPIHHRAFHDVLKARAMRLGVPVQMVRPDTYGGRAPRRRSRSRAPDRRLQDPATRAWNMVTAFYYKAGGTPWRIARGGDEYAACYVGVSFYKTTDNERVMTSMAQVFNRRGEGVVVRGGQARLESDDRQPHLEPGDAQTLLEKALQAYFQEHRTRPARVVIHKSSFFDDGELDGFRAAATNERVDSIDLVSVTKSFTRLFRDGYYPPLRGTLLTLDDVSQVLYLKGSVDFFRAWPGMYIPRPIWMRLEDVQESGRVLAQEVLALSKQNWNNTQFDGGWPITLRAAQRVGSILKHIGEHDPVQSRYSYYM